MKNAVIVPVGAKGGFVPKQLPAGPREAVQAEGTAAYTVFISSLLDITDNLGPDGVIPPENVVRHDDDDPYLVVAADKGTATFSDTANGISLEHRLLARRRVRERRLGRLRPQEDGHHRARRLGSGASATSARWTSTSARRRSRSRASATCRATCSATACCASAPSSWSRRSTIATSSSIRTPIRSAASPSAQRLFDLSRSSWQDYNKDYHLGRRRHLFAQGEGDHAERRGARAARARGREGHAAAGDDRDPQAQHRSAVVRRHRHLYPRRRARPTIRSATASTIRSASPARALRCKVVGEGANLGMTQRGRVEAAMRGVRLNTDAIDNSAGVNTSDVEVNIKIALTPRDARRPALARSARQAARRDDRRGRRGWCCATTISRRWRSRWRSGAGWKISASISA